MELEMTALEVKMAAVAEGAELGGLYQGLEEVASNVTYI